MTATTGSVRLVPGILIRMTARLAGSEHGPTTPCTGRLALARPWPRSAGVPGASLPGQGRARITRR